MFSNFSMHQNYLVSLLIVTLLPHPHILRCIWESAFLYSLWFWSRRSTDFPQSIYYFKNHTCTSNWLAQEMIQFWIYLNTSSILFFFCLWHKTLSKWIVVYFNLLVIQIHHIFFTWKAKGSSNYHAGSFSFTRWKQFWK